MLLVTDERNDRIITSATRALVNAAAKSIWKF